MQVLSYKGSFTDQIHTPIISCFTQTKSSLHAATDRVAVDPDTCMNSHWFHVNSSKSIHTCSCVVILEVKPLLSSQSLLDMSYYVITIALLTLQYYVGEEIALQLYNISN